MQHWMLPEVALDDYLDRVTHAVDLAATGHAHEGYDVLCQGLLRAEAAREGGEAWADELSKHYRLSLARYANRFGVRPN
jgi:hypothetical protein